MWGSIHDVIGPYVHDPAPERGSCGQSEVMVLSHLELVFGFLVYHSLIHRPRGRKVDHFAAIMQKLYNCEVHFFSIFAFESNKIDKIW